MREYINFGLLNPSHYEIVFITPILEGSPDEYENSTGKIAFEILRTAVDECAAAGLPADQRRRINQSDALGGHPRRHVAAHQTHMVFPCLSIACERLILGTSRWFTLKIRGVLLGITKF
jgi:hypothetical protein